jgi:hypothetical protein
MDSVARGKCIRRDVWVGQRFNLPKTPSQGVITSWHQFNGVSFTRALADAAAVASERVHGGYLMNRGIPHGPKLTEPQT